MKLVRLLTFLLSFLFAGQIFAVSYTGTDYTVDLPKGSWETTLDEDAGDGYDTFESDTMIVQVFAPNSDVYEVIKSGKKKDIAAMFLAYKKSV